MVTVFRWAAAAGRCPGRLSIGDLFEGACRNCLVRSGPPYVQPGRRRVGHSGPATGPAGIGAKRPSPPSRHRQPGSGGPPEHGLHPTNAASDEPGRHPIRDATVLRRWWPSPGGPPLLGRDAGRLSIGDSFEGARRNCLVRSGPPYVQSGRRRVGHSGPATGRPELLRSDQHRRAGPVNPAAAAHRNTASI